MNAYNFDSLNFDFDFGNIDQKKHEEILNSVEKEEK